MDADTTPPIMLIRHAEKPRPGERGVDLAGRPDTGALSVTGWARAGALVGLFAPVDRRPPPAPLVRPARLVAASRSGSRRSSRPRDTLALLAATLGLPVEEQDDDVASMRALAATLRRCDRPVLVSWRHGSLPALVDELLQQPGAAPARWPADRFDMVWVLEHDGVRRRLAQVPQRLLAGDAGHEMPNPEDGEATQPAPARGSAVRPAMGMGPAVATNHEEML